MPVTEPCIVSFLGPEHHDAFRSLVREYGPLTVVTPDACVSPRLGEVPGLTVLPLSRVAGASGSAAQDGRVADALHRHVAAARGMLGGLDDVARSAVQRLVAACIDRELPEITAVLHALEAVRAAYRVVLLVCSDDETPTGSVAAEWARTHGIRSLLLRPGGAPLDGKPIGHPVGTDYIAVAGARAKEVFVDAGVPAARIVVEGDPTCDGLRTLVRRRDHVRARIVRKYRIDPSARLVTFVPAPSTGLSAREAEGLWERGIEWFVEACEALAAAGPLLQAVVSDRQGEGGPGAAAFEGILCRLAQSSVSYLWTPEDAPELLVASDVVVTVRPSDAVSALVAGTPGVHLVGRSAVPSDLPFPAQRGLFWAEPSNLGRTIERLLNDEELRRQQQALVDQHLHEYQFGRGDGRSALRLGLVMARAAAPRPDEPAARPAGTSRVSRIVDTARHPVRTARWVLSRGTRRSGGAP